MKTRRGGETDLLVGDCQRFHQSGHGGFPHPAEGARSRSPNGGIFVTQSLGKGRYGRACGQSHLPQRSRRRAPRADLFTGQFGNQSFDFLLTPRYRTLIYSCPRKTHLYLSDRLLKLFGRDVGTRINRCQGSPGRAPDPVVIGFERQREIRDRRFRRLAHGRQQVAGPATGSKVTVRVIDDRAERGNRRGGVLGTDLKQRADDSRGDRPFGVLQNFDQRRDRRLGRGSQGMQAPHSAAPNVFVFVPQRFHEHR